MPPFVHRTCKRSRKRNTRRRWAQVESAKSRKALNSIRLSHPLESNSVGRRRPEHSDDEDQTDCEQSAWELGNSALRRTNQSLVKIVDAVIHGNAGRTSTALIAAAPSRVCKTLREIFSNAYE